jgi:hypothetical protein
MKPHVFVWVVKMRCGIHTNPIVWYFDNLEGLSCRDLLVIVVPELTSWLMV